MHAPTSKNKDCTTCESRKGTLLCDITDEALQIFNKSKITNSFRRGQYIFNAGSFPNGLYCINSGVIKLESEGSNGSNRILRIVKSGGVFGYRSLFNNEAYKASAVVHEDATVCHIPKSAIFELLQKNPDACLKFLSYVSNDLSSAEQRLCSESEKSASKRIAEALLFLKKNFAEQSWTRKEISEWAGTTPETVMRTLADFEKDGVIEQNGRTINIVNKNVLIERADLTL